MAPPGTRELLGVVGTWEESGLGLAVPLWMLRGSLRRPGMLE